MHTVEMRREGIQPHGIVGLPSGSGFAWAGVYFHFAKRADRPRQLVCQNNLKELAGGFARQVQDFGAFPCPARRELAICKA